MGAIKVVVCEFRSHFPRYLLETRHPNLRLTRVVRLFIVGMVTGINENLSTV